MWKLCLHGQEGSEKAVEVTKALFIDQAVDIVDHASVPCRPSPRIQGQSVEVAKAISREWISGSSVVDQTADVSLPKIVQDLVQDRMVE